MTELQNYFKDNYGLDLSEDDVKKIIEIAEKEHGKFNLTT
jgi:hypothetical protein